MELNRVFLLYRQCLFMLLSFKQFAGKTTIQNGVTVSVDA